MGEVWEVDRLIIERGSFEFKFQNLLSIAVFYKYILYIWLNVQLNFNATKNKFISPKSSTKGCERGTKIWAIANLISMKITFN